MGIVVKKPIRFFDSIDIDILLVELRVFCLSFPNLNLHQNFVFYEFIQLSAHNFVKISSTG